MHPSIFFFCFENRTRGTSYFKIINFLIDLEVSKYNMGKIKQRNFNLKRCVTLHFVIITQFVIHYKLR